MIRNPIICLTVFACNLIFNNLCSAQVDSEVSILARQHQSRHGRVVYSYQVVNHSQRSINAINIGRDVEHDRSELTEFPLGWTSRKGLSAASATSPPGWKVELITNEEAIGFDIEWWPQEAPAIAPGRTQAGYSIVLARPHPQYRNGHFTVTFSDATKATGKLTPEQTPSNR